MLRNFSCIKLLYSKMHYRIFYEARHSTSVRMVVSYFLRENCQKVEGVVPVSCHSSRNVLSINSQAGHTSKNHCRFCYHTYIDLKFPNDLHAYPYYCRKLKLTKNEADTVTYMQEDNI